MKFSDTKEQDDLLEKKMRELKREYQKQQMPKEQLQALQNKMKEMREMDKRKHPKTVWIKASAMAAVLVAAFLILPNTSAEIAHAMEQIPVIGRFVRVVTFQDYQYETERHKADMKIPEIKPEEKVKDQEVKQKLDQTTEEINAEIREITGRLKKEFEENMKEEWGYQDIIVDSEVLATTPDYFTLKLICYQGSGSGAEWDYFYTIDLKTGERLKLKDIFKEGTDYITPISENIKQQMKKQMDADENVYYWLNDEIEEWNFKSITEETSFYLNEKGNVVIGFNEGDVAPMYMGTVEFEIPAKVLKDIRK